MTTQFPSRARVLAFVAAAFGSRRSFFFLVGAQHAAPLLGKVSP
jgi:hypothetical protein